VNALDRAAFPAEMYVRLAALCQARYHTALAEGQTEQQAFEEIVHIILDTYREAIAS
jgi:hypothetical protein